MSVLIKGMKMPKHCWQCHFHDEADVCEMLGLSCMRVWGEEKTLPDCPLIEVPDHGDLIDRDELMMKMWGASAYASNQRSCNVRAVFVRDIEVAPVVIPAERSEDGET